MYITSILEHGLLNLGKSKNIMGALYKGFIVTAITSLLILYPVTDSIVGLQKSINNSGKLLSVWIYIFVECWICYYRFINLDY